MNHTTMAQSRTTESISRTGRQGVRRASAGRATRPQFRKIAEIAVLIVIAVLLVVGAVTTSHPRAESPQMTSFKVQSGDTLWNLAEAHPVDGLTTQQVVALLAEVNDLSSAVVTPGELILLPAGALDQRVASR